MAFFGAVLGAFVGAKAASDDDGPGLGEQVEEILGDVYDPSEEFK